MSRQTARIEIGTIEHSDQEEHHDLGSFWDDWNDANDTYAWNDWHVGYDANHHGTLWIPAGECAFQQEIGPRVADDDLDPPCCAMLEAKFKEILLHADQHPRARRLHSPRHTTDTHRRFVIIEDRVPLGGFRRFRPAPRASA